MFWTSMFKAMCLKAMQRGFRRRNAREVVRKARESFFCSRIEMLEDRIVPTTYSWLPTAAGTYAWNSAANWSVVSGTGTTFPSVQGDVAIITSALTGAETIDLNQAIIVGTIDLGASSGTNAFTIAAGTSGTLALSVASGSATVAKTSGGADQITAPLTFSSNVIFNNSLPAPNTLAITSATTGAATVTINSPTTNTGEVDFTAAAALSSAGNITVDAGTLGINTITLTSSRTISIASGANVNSSGTIYTTANGSSTFSAVSGAGTLNLTSTTDSASAPDIYFNSNDTTNSTANYGSRILTPVNLGSSQRYIEGLTDHNGVTRYTTGTDCIFEGTISGTGGMTFIAQSSYTAGGPMEVPFYLYAANTFTGPVIIQRGAVYLGSATSLNGNAITLDPASGTNAYLFLYGHNETIGSLTSSGAGTAEIANTAGNASGYLGPTTAVTLTVTQGTAGAFAGILTNNINQYYTSETGTYPLSLVVEGASPLSLGGASTYTGTTTVTGGGVLSVSSDANLGAAPTSATAGSLVLDGGTLLASASLTLNSNRGIAVGDPTTASTGGSISVATGAGLTYGGIIANNTGGSDSLTVGSSGNTGTLILTGTNTFTGGLTVNAGTLAGSGTVGSLVNNATINPGASTGAAVLNTGNLSFGTGGGLTFDLNGAGTAGTNYDQLNVTGTINLTNAALNLNVNYTPTIGDSYTVINNVNGAAITGTFNGLSQNGYFVANGDLFQINYQANGNNSVVITAVQPPVYYVEADGWGGSYSVGQTIQHPNPLNSNASPAVFGGGSAVAGSGYKAFTSVDAALAQAADDGAVGATIVVNGGTFNEDVVVNQGVTLDLQYDPSIFNSLAGTVSNASVQLNSVSLTTGGDNSSTTFSSPISGSGSLIKVGTGTMTLTGANTTTGTTEVSNGVLLVGSTATFSASSTVQVDASGDLQLGGNAVTFGSLTGSGTVEDASASAATLTVTTATTDSFGGLLRDGTGGGKLNLTVNGAGTFTLSGTTNTYTGVTTISTGVLAVAALAAGGTASSIGESTNAASNLVLLGGTVDYLTAGSTASTDRSITIGTGGGTIDVASGTSTVTISGTVSGGSNTFTSGGAGTLVFSTANAFSTGNITVSSGTLGINSITVSETSILTIDANANVNSFGTISTTAYSSPFVNEVVGAGTLNLTSTTDSASSPDLNFNANDANSNTSNANDGTGISANINLGSSQRYIWGKTNHNAFGEYPTTPDVLLSGIISGSGGLSFIAQNDYTGSNPCEVPFVLSGANTFTGEVEIQRGDVFIDNASALTGSNTLLLDPASGNIARFYLDGFSATISNLQSTGAGTAAIANSPGRTAGAATLTIEENSNTTFGGTIVNTQTEYSSSGTVGALSVVETGTGTLTLSGTNTYTGTTTVTGGSVLSVSSDANLGTDPTSATAGDLVLDGGTLLASATFTLNSNRGIAVGDPTTASTGGGISVASGATLTSGGIIANNTGGSDSLTVGSSGNTGTLILNGANTFTGAVTVNAGTLAGSGTVGSIVDNAIINPGASTGAAILNTGNLSFGTGGGVTFDLNGVGTAGTNYDQLNVTGTINLTNATLNLNVNYTPTIGDSYTVINNVSGAAITGTFNGLIQNGYLVANGHLFQINYQANGTNSVTITAVQPAVYYAEADGWGGSYAVGQTIANPNPLNSNASPAVFGGGSAVAGSGYTAFTSVDAALAQAADDGAVGAIIVVNGGTFNEDVVVNQGVTLDLQYEPSTFNSFAGNNSNANLELSGVALTTGGDNTSTIYSGIMSGNGGLIKIGTGTMTLSGNDTTFTGSAEIGSGILLAGSSAAFGAGTAVQVDSNGDLQLDGNSTSIGSLAGSGIVQDASATAAKLTVGAANTSTTFSGTLQDGTGGGSLSLTLNGTGLFTVSGNNTYSGGTIVSAGTLQIGSSTALGASSGSVTVLSGAVLDLDGQTITDTNPLTLNGTGINNSGALINSSSTPATYAGLLTLGSVASIVANSGNIILSNSGTITGTGFGLTLGGSAAASSIASIIGTGSGTLTVNGSGTWTLSTANAYQAGNITVSSGTLAVNSITLSSSTTMSIASGAFVNSFGTIDLIASGSVHPNVEISGAGTLNLTSTTDSSSSPDLYFDSNDTDNAANWGTGISANINLGSSQRYFWGNDNHDSYGEYTTSADAYLSGSISGSGGITFTAQNSYENAEVSQTDFVLAGANTFTGEVEIQRGAVYLANANALTGDNALLLDPASGFNSWFYLYGNSTTISNLQSTGAGTSIIANSPGNSVGAATLTIAQSNNTTYAGTIVQVQSDYAPSGTVGALSVVETGTGTLTLSGTNTYTGTTTVTGGVLSVSSDANLGTDPTSATAGALVLDGGTLLASASFTLNSNRGIAVGDAAAPNTAGEIDVVNGATLTYGGIVADNTGGSDSLTVGSSGNTGTLILSGANTFTGAVTVNAGTLAGSGTVGSIVDNAIINPGASTGAAILNTGNLSFGTGGGVTFDLNGVGTAGTNYDQLNVTGTINLTNAALNLNVNYTPTVGDSYTLIDNVSGGTITGTFSGLPEGSTVVSGNNYFLISYLGGNSNDVTLTAVAGTTTSVSSTPASPITPGTSIDFTATISGSPSVGTVTFYAGPGLTNPIGSPVNVSGGTATSAADTTLPLGNNTITAVYSGGTGFASSQGTETVAVDASTSTTVTSNPSSPITQGTSIDFTASVSGSPSVGTVAFYAGPGLTNEIGSPVNVSGGTATSVADTTLPVGNDTITAVYSGGTGFAASQGTETVVVNASTTTTVTSNPSSPITQGTSIDFTATISGSPSVGTVTFYAGPGLTNQIGSPVTVSSGTATSAADTSLPVGNDTITAVYSGGTGFAGSQGTETVAVNASTTTSVSSTPSSPITQGDSIDFTATISGSPSVGTVTFYAGPGLTNQIGSPVTVSSGTATSGADTTLPVGSDTITAVYSGGASFAGSQGSEMVTVNDQPPTVATTAAANPATVTGSTTALSVLGADVDYAESSLTYTWATIGSPPASVSFSANGTNAAKNTTATFSAAGSYDFQVTITAPDLLTATSTVNVTVDQTLTSITVSPSAVSLYAGQTQTFAATGIDQFGSPLVSQPTFTWSTTAGSIDSSGHFVAQDAPGTDTVTAMSGTVSSTATVTVTGVPPAFTSSNNTTFTVGTSGLFSATASGYPAPTFIESGSLPSGVTFTSAGVLSGMPAAATGGMYPITIIAANGLSPDAIQSFTLTVDQAPAITSSTGTTFTVGAVGSFSVTATGYPAESFTETGPLPSGVTLTAAGMLSGTPAAGTGGTYPITIAANNGVSPNATQSFTLTVDQAPAITSANSTTFTVGTPGSFSETASGFPASTFTEYGLLPSGVTLTSAGVLSGTPAAGTGGTYPITITATNSVSPNATQSFTLTVDQAPAITSSAGTTFTVGSSGTFAVTATGYPAESFTETGPLPSGVTLTAAGMLSGTPAAGTGGTYPITLAATNGVSPNATQSFTLTVDQAPAITSGNSTAFTVGADGSFSATASGYPAPTFTEIGTLPSGVTLSPAGVLSGTPASGAGVSYSIVIEASNGVSPEASQAFTLTVDHAPAITSASGTTLTVGAAGSFAVTASGYPSSTFTESGPLPSGVTLSTAGVLSGTPAAGTGGTYPITIAATNGVSPDATQSFTLTVDQAPAITSANTTTFAVGTSGSFSETASGFPTPTFTEYGLLPSGVTLTSAGVLSGTPAAGTGGTYPITITATNGVSPHASQSFTLTVEQAPAITSSTGTTFTVGSSGLFTVTATGYPAESFSETGPLPSGVTLTAAGVLSGTPAAGAGGTYPITIAATNGISPDATQSFTLTVDEAPAITSANSTTFTVGASGSLAVTASGYPAPTFTEIGSLPSGVTLTSAGVLSGTPAAGTGGSYSIVLEASNGVSPEASQTFTLTVDQAPAITSSTATTFTAGSSGSFAVTATGYPTSTFTESGPLPSGVTLSIAGVLTGTPAVGTGGTYPITITATNGISPNATQSFTLTVDQAPVITSANTTTFTVGASGSLAVTASGYPAPTFTEIGALPSGVTLTSAGVLSGTPVAGTGGSYSIVLEASNGVSPEASQTFTLTVDQAPAITSATATTFAVGSSGSFAMTATGYPAESFSETGPLPTGVTLTAAGVLSGTPAAGTGGTYPITITATNGISPDATQSFTLTVDQAPAITSANTTTFTVGASGSLAVTASGYPAPTFTEIGALPSGVTLTSAGVLSGTPAAGTGGSYAIVIEATNGTPPDASQAFTLTVDQAPAITSSASTGFSIGSSGSFAVTASGYPAATLSETGPLPSGVTLTAAGVLSGTPAAGTAGTYPITITAANGIAPAATQSFTLTIGQAPGLSNSFVTVSPGSVAAGATTTITLQAVDTYGNDLTVGGLHVVFALGGGTGQGTITAATDNGNGTYTATFTGQIAGSNTITATIGGQPVTSAAPTLTVTPGTISITHSQVSTALPSVQLGGETTVVLQGEDSYGNLETTGGATNIAFELENSTGGHGTISSVKDNGNGTYTAIFIGTVDGPNTIEATIGGSPVTSTTPVSVTGAAVNLADSLLSVAAATVQSGSGIQVSLQAESAKGVKETSGGLIVAFGLGSGSGGQGTFGPVSYLGNGVYTATFTGTLAGKNTIIATIDGLKVTSKAPAISVLPGTLSYSNSLVTVSSASVSAGGTTTTITFQPRDAAGNKLTLKGLPVSFALGGNGTAQGTFSNGGVAVYKNGVYTATFKGTLVGGSTIVTTVNSEAIASNPPVISVTPGTALAANSKLTISEGADTVSSGGSITLMVQAVDANGNLETTGGLKVSFKLASKTGGLGTFGKVTDNKNGTYTVTFTGTTAGTNTIEATIGGKTVSSTVAITVL